MHFWLTFIFFNMVFFPMHILGVGGHMRRIYNPMQYEFLQGMQPINVMITLSALALGLSQIPFVFNFFATVFRWNAKWFRVLTQAVSAIIVGFIGYKSVAVMFEGLMEPEVSTGGAHCGHDRRHRACGVDLPLSREEHGSAGCRRAPESLGRQHARMGGAHAGAARELRPHAAGCPARTL